MLMSQTCKLLTQHYFTTTNSESRGLGEDGNKHTADKRTRVASPAKPALGTYFPTINFLLFYKFLNRQCENLFATSLLQALPSMLQQMRNVLTLLVQMLSRFET